MTTVATQDQQVVGRKTGDYRVFRAAGATYVVAWLVGLVVAPSAPSQTAADAKAQAFFLHHQTATLIQALLVHGIAGVAFAAFVAALARSPLVPRSGSARSILLVAGLAAAAVSLVQVGLEVAINRHVTATSSASTTASLFHAVNLADTGKLVLLGLAIAAATRAMEDTGASRGWLRGLGYALLPVLVIGGLAFVIDSAALSAVLDLSLLLLLLWVGVVSVRAPRLEKTATKPAINTSGERRSYDKGPEEGARLRRALTHHVRHVDPGAGALRDRAPTSGELHRGCRA